MKYIGILVLLFSVNVSADLATDLAKAFNITYQAGCFTGLREIIKFKNLTISEKDRNYLNSYCKNQADAITKQIVKKDNQ